MRKRCIGFGEHEGKCATKPVGKGLWCARCERLRRAHIDRRMKAIAETFEKEGRPL